MESRRLSKEEQKFTRVALICVDFLQLPLIDILDHEIKPADLYNKISTCSKLSNGKGLQPGQQKICFLKPPNKPDYNKFDVTLLYKLVRNLCSSLTPQQDWGKEPKAIDILIVHDIERLRSFRNEIAHAVSSEFTDDKFEQFWKKMESVIQRIQNFTSTLGCKTNYMQRLKKIKSIEFGYDDLEKYKFCLESIFRSDQPEILIKGDKEIEVICGDTACFELELKQADLTHWTVTWHKKIGTRIEQINTSTTRYSDSTDMQLVIHSVCKEDKGNYQALLTEKVSNGKSALQVVSNVISLHTPGEPPFSPELIVTNGREDIFVHYKYEVPERSPRVCMLQWTKNGVKLNIKNEKYTGGGLDDDCLTIKSPTTNDRGIYCCTVSNAVGSESQEVKLDVPNAKIFKETTVYCGSSTKLSAEVLSCPSPDEVKWQRSSDGNSFNFIDIDEPEYFRSTNDIESPLLRIPKATSDVQLYYRLYLRNKLGENISNTIYLNITGSAPNIMVSHDICFQNYFVKLIGKVYLYSGKLPAIQDVFWTKDGEKVDIQGSGGKYCEVGVDDPSLIIHNVNHRDIGSYQLTATNAVGSTKSDVIVLGKPQIVLERTERKEDGSYLFTMTIKAIPEPTNIQWSMKENKETAFELFNINDDEYKGTTDTFPHPVLVVKPSKFEKYKFQIEVKNFIGNSAFIIQGEKHPKVPKSDNNIHDMSAIENSTIPNIISEKDIDKRKLCNPCFSESLQVQATHFCKTCDDPDLLCETCAKHHTKQKPFKDHELSKDIGHFKKSEKGIYERKFCEPCFCDNLQVQATHFCKTCDDPEFLCETCAQYHTKQKPFKDHELSKDIGDCQKSANGTCERKLCNPCFSENFQVQATHFCKTCDDPELLCETCAKYHTKQKPFKDHELSKDIGDCQKSRSKHVNDLLCEPCSIENNLVPAAFFCKTCDDPEPLCDACAYQHTRQKLSRNHEMSKYLEEFQKSWFFSSCDRDLAEKILVKGGKFGNTLMRESSSHKVSGNYVISKIGKINGVVEIEHFEVERVDKGYRIKVENDHEPQKNLTDVINTFRFIAGFEITIPMKTNDLYDFGLSEEYSNRYSIKLIEREIPSKSKELPDPLLDYEEPVPRPCKTFNPGILKKEQSKYKWQRPLSPPKFDPPATNIQDIRKKREKKIPPTIAPKPTGRPQSRAASNNKGEDEMYPDAISVGIGKRSSFIRKLEEQVVRQVPCPQGTPKVPEIKPRSANTTN